MDLCAEWGGEEGGGKGSQKGAKREPKGSQMGAKGGQKGAKMEAKTEQSLAGAPESKEVENGSRLFFAFSTRAEKRAVLGTPRGGPVKNVGAQKSRFRENAVRAQRLFFRFLREIPGSRFRSILGRFFVGFRVSRPSP